MSVNRTDRRVITFYSFKGGVGRSMALANVAFRLANTHGLRVIAVDWDLEAPGLHRFFGMSSGDARLASARGVVDYFIEWKAAVARNDPKPPDVTGWILPIHETPNAPRFGALSLLLAGGLDAGYDERLASLDWRRLYEDSAGAAAVETLREQLVAAADVVLIDSRTGHTDTGGICTIQLPDAVVLMTAPNEQSLEGVDQIARRIAKASEQERAGRKRSKVWLSVARVPSVEESYLVDEWFKEHGEWFSRRVEEELWEKDDHPEGLKSFEIPHRGRWGVGETLLSNPLVVRPDDQLFLAYERLTKTVFRWLVGMDDMIRSKRVGEQSGEDPGAELEELRTRVAEAEQRGDATGLTRALIELGATLIEFEQPGEALTVLERASAAAIGSTSRDAYAFAITIKGQALMGLGRYEEARSALEAGLSIARELDNNELTVVALSCIGTCELVLGHHEASLAALTERIELVRASGLQVNMTESLRSIELIHERRELDHNQQLLISQLYEMLPLIRKRGDIEAEEQFLDLLVSFASVGAVVEDIDAIRTRLEELRRNKPTPHLEPSGGSG